MSMWVQLDQVSDQTYQYTITGADVGAVYHFKIRAVNVLGHSEFSDVTALKLAAPPGEFTETATVSTSQNGFLVVSWVGPDSNGDVITEYQIEFYASGEYYEDTMFCDGSDPEVFVSQTCSIPMQYMTATYGNILTAGDSIEFRVRAFNSFGWSAWSSISTSGMLIQSMVSTVSESFVINLIEVSESHITIGWEGLEQGIATGYSEIRGYEIEYDASTNGSIWFTVLSA